jgi:hypothetical protein
MMSMTKMGWGTTWVLAAGGIVSLVVACSGSTGHIGGNDGGADGGGGGDPGTCTTSALNATRACVPGTAKSGVELSLEVDGEGCLGCGRTALPCQVQVTGQQIFLKLQQQSCVSNLGCPEVCVLPQLKCTIPPLAAGRYTLEFTEGLHSSEDPVRSLVVADDATMTSCDTGDPNDPPKPIIASDFPQVCVGDADCALITEGNVCAPCRCQTAAIAKSALPAYEATVRERQALCARGGSADQASCAPCQSRFPKCNAGKCDTTTTL